MSLFFDILFNVLCLIMLLSTIIELPLMIYNKVKYNKTNECNPKIDKIIYYSLMISLSSLFICLTCAVESIATAFLFVILPVVFILVLSPKMIDTKKSTDIRKANKKYQIATSNCIKANRKNMLTEDLKEEREMARQVLLDVKQQESIHSSDLKIRIVIAIITFILGITSVLFYEDSAHGGLAVGYYDDIRFNRIVRLEAIMASTPLDEGLEGYQTCEAFEKILVEPKWSYNGILDFDKHTIRVEGRTKEDNKKLVVEWKCEGFSINELIVKYDGTTYKDNAAWQIYSRIMNY